MSKFLSLEWFKNKVDHSIEKVIEKKLDKLVEEVDNDSSPQENPYKTIKLVNDVLTIVLHDDSIISKKMLLKMIIMLQSQLLPLDISIQSLVILM